MTLQDALVNYRVYAQAEGRIPKTITWICDSVGYFANFLGSKQQDIDSICGRDLRRFVLMMQRKDRYTNHPYNRPRKEKLSPQIV